MNTPRKRARDDYREPEVQLCSVREVPLLWAKPARQYVPKGFWRSVARRARLLGPNEALRISLPLEMKASHQHVRRMAREEGLELSVTIQDRVMWVYRRQGERRAAA